jgi:hypothetical protein
MHPGGLRRRIGSEQKCSALLFQKIGMVLDVIFDQVLACLLSLSTRNHIDIIFIA